MARRSNETQIGYRRPVTDFRPSARVALAGCWIAGQATLVLTASGRPDHIFGFQMFPEASTIEIHLSRETSRGDLAAPGGEWSARDASGQQRHFSWRDRIREPLLGAVDERIFASYGVDTQLARLQRALDDVVAHVPEDGERRRLRADVRVWKNGRPPSTVTLTSHARKSG